MTCPAEPVAIPTLAACLTPPGAAAIATLAVRGPRAWEIVRGLFRTKQRAGTELTPQAGRFWLGRLGDDAADEVVLTAKRTEPVPWLEVHCHGGREVVRFLLETLEARGVEVCTWQQLEQRTADDPVHALAVAALAEAPTTRTAAILLDQLHGAFSLAVEEIVALLEKGEVDEARRALELLASRVELGRHLTSPWRVVVAGAPNVGKSSLVNALAGYQRSIVAPTPGTTRDVVTTRIAVDGWPVELADTAGLRGEAEDLEEQGITRALEAAEKADLCLWLLDASTEPVWPAENVSRLRLVVNKIDLPPAWDLARASEAPRVCSLTGDGVPELCQALSIWLVPDPPSPGAPVPFAPVLQEAIHQARDECRAGGVQEATVLLRGFGVVTQRRH